MRYLKIIPLLISFLISVPSYTQSDKKPNVIVIFMDDMGFGDLSSYGHPSIETPQLDRLAREGQQWMSFYTASSVCSPSRGALLTGRYPVRLGLGGEKKRVFFPNSLGGLPPEEITIAEVLKSNGYSTAAIGKWHLGHLPQFMPQKQGFDYFYGLPYSNDMSPIGPNHEHLFHLKDSKNWDIPLMENQQVIEQPVDQSTITKRYTEKTIQFIETNKDKPFFIYLAHAMVHVPLFASDDFVDSSRRGLYGDVMNEIDHGVGKIVAALERLDLDKNTLIVFTSDNGPWLSYGAMGGSAGPLENGKGTTWEGGMRVPGIFYMPGTIQPGLVHGMGSTLDLLPTIASITGSTIPAGVELDGVDLTPSLRSGQESPRDHFIYYRKQEIYAIRKGPFKVHYITEDCYQRDNQRMEHEHPLLYQLEHDPGEQYDVSEKYPELIKEFTALKELTEKKVLIRPSELDKLK